jgi:hypothetical protein
MNKIRRTIFLGAFALLAVAQSNAMVPQSYSKPVRYPQGRQLRRFTTTPPVPTQQPQSTYQWAYAQAKKEADLIKSEKGKRGLPTKGWLATARDYLSGARERELQRLGDEQMLDSFAFTQKIRKYMAIKELIDIHEKIKISLTPMKYVPTPDTEIAYQDYQEFIQNPDSFIEQEARKAVEKWKQTLEQQREEKE